MQEKRFLMINPTFFLMNLSSCFHKYIIDLEIEHRLPTEQILSKQSFLIVTFPLLFMLFAADRPEIFHGI